MLLADEKTRKSPDRERGIFRGALLVKVNGAGGRQTAFLCRQPVAGATAQLLSHKAVQ